MIADFGPRSMSACWDCSRGGSCQAHRDHRRIGDALCSARGETTWGISAQMIGAQAIHSTLIRFEECGMGKTPESQIGGPASRWQASTVPPCGFTSLHYAGDGKAARLRLGARPARGPRRQRDVVASCCLGWDNHSSGDTDRHTTPQSIDLRLCARRRENGNEEMYAMHLARKLSRNHF